MARALLFGQGQAHLDDVRQERPQRTGVAQQGQQEEVHPVGSRERLRAAGLVAQPLHGEAAILLPEQDVGHLQGERTGFQSVRRAGDGGSTEHHGLDRLLIVHDRGQVIAHDVPQRVRVRGKLELHVQEEPPGQPEEQRIVRLDLQRWEIADRQYPDDRGEIHAQVLQDVAGHGGGEHLGKADHPAWSAEAAPVGAHWWATPRRYRGTPHQSGAGSLWAWRRRRAGAASHCAAGLWWRMPRARYLAVVPVP
jgi:hypothetical protein